MRGCVYMYGYGGGGKENGSDCILGYSGCRVQGVGFGD